MNEKNIINETEEIIEIFKTHFNQIEDLNEDVELSEHFVSDLNKDSLKYSELLLKETSIEQNLIINYTTNSKKFNVMSKEELQEFRPLMLNVIKNIDYFESRIDIIDLKQIVDIIAKTNDDSIQYDFKEEQLEKIDGNYYDDLRNVLKSSQDLLEA